MMGFLSSVGVGKHSKRRGTVSLAALFMVLFATAMLWAVFGIGKTLYVREGLQDAADAAAFSAAVFHAKGMNLIALINLIMAILVTVLIVLKMAQVLLQIVAVVLFALAYYGGATAAAASQAQNGASQLSSYYKKAKNIIEPVLEGLHALQEATAHVVPAVALVDGMVEASKKHPPAEGAFAIPARVSLPIEEDEFARTCKEAGRLTVDATMKVSGLEYFGPPVWPLEKGLEAMSALTSVFVCNLGDGNPPLHKVTMDVRYPRPAGIERCEEDIESADCQKAQRQLELSQPMAGSGACRAQCGHDGPYESFARMARVSCDPTNRGGLKDFTWQEREVQATLVREKGGWRETTRRTGPLRLKEGQDDPPCGRGGRYSDEWNLNSGPHDASLPSPVCSQESRAENQREGSGTTRQLEYVEVLRIFSCVREEERGFPVGQRGDPLGSGGDHGGTLAGDTRGAPESTGGGQASSEGQGQGSVSSSGSGSNSNSNSGDVTPHKVEEGLEMGDEAFQIRAVSFGPEPGPGKAAGWVRLIERDGKNTQAGGQLSSVVERLMQTVGRLSVAQAEYYIAGKLEPEDWMWTLQWTARLKRFRLSSGDDSSGESNADGGQGSQQGLLSNFSTGPDIGSVEKTCSLAGGDGCGEVQSGLTSLQDWIKH